ncbi:MAG: hypothetical protein R3298_11060 [Gammaproteobacteria bacterium]|nr:hypothetical protein [Gammaproteobacteria bacterium]
MAISDKIISAQRRIIDRLIEWEELVGELYKRYAVRFPEQGPQWRQLAREEQTHAGALGAIRRMLDAGHHLEGIGEFDSEIIEQEVNDVRRALKRSHHSQLRLDEAVKTARQIESSIIESKFYDVVTCDAPEFKRIAERLRSDTIRHLEKLRSIG